MNMAEEFALRDKDIPKPKYNYGDRVFARFEKIPVLGMVVRETDKIVMIHVDLPFKVKDVIHNIVQVPVKAVKLLVVM